MISVEEREAIRRAYYLEGKSKRQIAREHNHSRKTVDKAVDNQPPQPYRLSKAKPSPVFGAFRAEPTNCWPKMRICRPSSSIPDTRSTNCSRQRAIRAVRRGYACT